MRIVLRVLAVVAALGVALLVAVALLLPRVVESDAVRTRIEEAAAEATGGTLAYRGLDAGILPPRLVVEGASVTAPDAEAPALSAERADLRVAILPLLVGAVVVDSLHIAGADVRLERTDAGVSVPGLFPAEPEEPPSPPSAEPAEPSEDEELRLAVRRVDLEDGRVELVDRTLTPPVRWELLDVEGRLRGESWGEPVRVELGTRLASGGELRAEGEISLDGGADLTLDLAALALAPLAPYAEAKEDEPFAGLLEGTARLQREAGGDPAVEADLRVREADLVAGDAALAGTLALRLTLAGASDDASGTLYADATEAELRVPDVLAKPAGTAARVEGPLRVTGDGVRLEDAAVALHTLEGTLDLASTERTTLRLDAPSFELAGFEEILASLEGYPARGRARFEDFRVATGPLAVTGRFVLEGVRLEPEGEPALGVEGALVGAGDELTSEALMVTLGEERVPVGLRLSKLSAETPHLDVTAKGEGLESGALMAAAGQPADLLTGPLDLDAVLGGPLPAEGSILRQLDGRIVFEIAPGTLKGVSFLESAFGGLEGVGRAALLAGEREERLARFYGDRFERLGGTIRLGDGEARSDDLRLDYGAYHVDLRGSIGLEDLALDLTGQITLEEEVDRALTDDSQGGRRRVIPLAHVGGTLPEPRVELTQEALRGFAAAYTADSRRREKWEEEIDERLGEGAGREVLRALDDVLRGGSGGDSDDGGAGAEEGAE